jgi:hypothetical protein
VAVRSCVAHLLLACPRHARGEAVDAFRRLIATNDRPLTTRQIFDLMAYIGLGEPEAIEPVIERMLGAAYAEAREAGGWTAAFAGLDVGLGHLLSTIRAAGQWQGQGRARASSTVSSAAGSASRRSSGMACPLRIERP